ncbi:MAG TPA: hypothetical protein VGL55_09135 [Steroidobacteraceae bacterium]|jgi:hypothetical protein
MAGSLILATALLAPAVRGEEPWFTRFEQDRAQTNAACQERQYEACAEGLRKLLPLVDGRPDIQCVLAAVQARLGQTQAAADSFRVCARSQLDFSSLMSAPSLQVLRSLPEIAEIERAAQRAGTAPEHHRVSVRLNDPELVTEDLLYIRTDGSFLVSSVRERKVVRISPDRTVSDFLTTQRIPAWGLFALALDPSRGALWVTTSAVPQSPPYSSADDGRSAILRIDQRSRTLLGRYELSDGKPHAFGDMTLAADGAVYVADGRGGGVYVARPGHVGLEAVVSPGRLHSPQTPALSADGTTLLVPDYTRGIARVRVSDHDLVWLQHPPELALFGLDGFYWRGHTLVGIQNGTTPERILVMQLDAECSRITSWHVALAGVPGLGDPTHGLLRGRDFYFLANSGWDRYDDDGHPNGGVSASPPEVWQLRLPADVLRAARCAPAAPSSAGNVPMALLPRSGIASQVG